MKKTLSTLILSAVVVLITATFSFGYCMTTSH